MPQVRTLTITTILLSENDKTYISEKREYDNKNNLISNILFNELGEITSHTTYQYNENGNITKIVNVDNEEDTSENKTYEYDNEGRLIKEVTDYFQGFKTILTYTYDGKNIRINSIDEDGSIEESSLQEYSDNDNLIAESKYDDNNKLVSKTINSYNHQLKIIKKDELDAKGRIEKSHQYYYDNSDNLIGIKTVNRKGKTLDWVRLEYDENNRPIKQVIMSGHTILLSYSDNSRNEKHIDPHGNVTEDTTTITNKEGNVIEKHSPEIKLIYTYDYYQE